MADTKPTETAKDVRPASTVATPTPPGQSTAQPSTPVPSGASAAVSPAPLAPPAAVPLRPQVELDREARQRSQKDHDERQESSAARSGAQAVADAVKRVADAVVNEAARFSTGEDLDFVVTGTPGGRFRISGPARSFGSSGVVLFGGRQIETDGWSAEHIYGKLPSDVPTNVEVIVRQDENTERRGFFRG